MKNLCFIFLLLVSIAAKAQINLVPNPSFEDTTSCPYGSGNFTVSGWFPASYGSPDYFNSCSINEVGVPSNDFGYQNAFHGNAYIGERVYHHGGTFFEYSACQLIQPLILDKVYKISLYISLAEISDLSTNNFSLLFLNQNQFYNTSDYIPETPQVVFQDQIIDTLGWQKLSTYYVADGSENFLVLGNFLSNSTIEIPLKNNGYEFSYMYIDSISIVESDAVDINYIIIPNVFTPNNDGYNDVFEIQFLPPNSQLTIYNRWGSQVYQSNNYQNNWTGENLNDGVYYYMLTLPSGNTTKGTVTILRN